MAVRAHMHQVKNHVEFLSVYFFFAGMMKMKLHQRVVFAVNGDAASGFIIHADGVAVVDDLPGAGRSCKQQSWGRDRPNGQAHRDRNNSSEARRRRGVVERKPQGYSERER